MEVELRVAETTPARVGRQIHLPSPSRSAQPLIGARDGNVRLLIVPT